MGSERGFWGGSLTLRCQHLTQQKMQSPAKSRRPKIPPSTIAKSFGEALVNTGGKTARVRERDVSAHYPLSGCRAFWRAPGRPRCPATLGA